MKKKTSIKIGKYKSFLEYRVHENLKKKLPTLKFEVNFKPLWLKNHMTNRRLELDLYEPSYKIAIEVQGPSHNNVNQLARDIIKRKLCKENNVKLFYVSTANIKQALIQQIKKNCFSQT